MIIAHTPDPDDSFMFYAMFENKIRTKLQYEQVVKDIETLNQEAPRELYDVTAMSAPAYATYSDKYLLTSAGASFGLRYGPIVIAKDEIDLNGATVASPGTLTSAHTLYRMFMPEPSKLLPMRFDTIVDAVLKGDADAGIIIHDEQLTYMKKGLIKVGDLYREWNNYAPGLPIPLGFNVISRKVSAEEVRSFMEDFRASIRYGEQHEDDALQYSMKYARYQDIELERTFVKMYVNKLTYDFGKDGRSAIERYFQRAVSKGILDEFVPEIVW